MQRFVSIILVLICSSAFASGVPSPATPRPMVDSAGNLLSTDNPLPVVGTITPRLGASGETIGSTTSLVAANGFSQTINISCSTTRFIPSLPNRVEIILFNHHATETCYTAPGAQTATPGMGIPIFPRSSISRLDGPEVPYPVAATTTVLLGVEQKRRVP